MSDDIKKRRRGRPPGSKNKTALVRLDKAAAAVAVQVETLKAEDKLYTLGKDVGLRLPKPSAAGWRSTPTARLTGQPRHPVQ